MLKKFLNESMTPQVFRIELLENFYRTITENKFYTSLAYAKGDIVNNNDYMYFLSTTRTRHNSYTVFGVGSTKPSAIMTLNGDKLNNRFKSKPVRYFKYRSVSSDESEDRLLTNKKTIENAISYIKSVDFWLPPFPISEEQYNKFLDVLSILDRSDIPYFIYLDHEAYLVSNKKKAVASYKFKEGLKTLKDKINDSFPEDASIGENKYYTDFLKIVKLLSENIIDGRDNSAAIRKILNGSGTKENLLRMINNFKIKNYDVFFAEADYAFFENLHRPETRDLLHDFMLYLRKHNLKTMHDLGVKIKLLTSNFLKQET